MRGGRGDGKPITTLWKRLGSFNAYLWSVVGGGDLVVKEGDNELVLVCLVTQSDPTLWDPMDCSPPGSSVHGDSPGKNTGVGCHALLQGIFPIQGLNPGLLHCRQILYQLSYKGSPHSTLGSVNFQETFLMQYLV